MLQTPFFSKEQASVQAQVLSLPDVTELKTALEQLLRANSKSVNNTSIEAPRSSSRVSPTTAASHTSQIPSSSSSPETKASIYTNPESKIINYQCPYLFSMATLLEELATDHAVRQYRSSTLGELIRKTRQAICSMEDGLKCKVQPPPSGINILLVHIGQYVCTLLEDILDRYEELVLVQIDPSSNSSISTMPHSSVGLASRFDRSTDDDDLHTLRCVMGLQFGRFQKVVDMLQDRACGREGCRKLLDTIRVRVDSAHYRVNQLGA